MTLCRKCGKEIADGLDLCEDCTQMDASGDAFFEELLQNMESGEVASDEPAASGESGGESEEDIDELLKMLSQDYEDDFEELEDDELSIEEEPVPVLADFEEGDFEASLFSEDDGSIFADGSDEVAVDDIFQEALSVVDYSEKEEEEGPVFDDAEVVSLDDFGEDAEGEEVDALFSLAEETEEVPVVAAPVAKKPKKVKAPKAPKDSFWKRIFGNVVTETTAAEEAKAREEEEATAEEKAAAKEEKKKQQAQEKEEKAEQNKVLKEQKDAAKAAAAAQKAAAKEEKKRLKAEMEANEVVGKINPIGAAIVMVFFGVICIASILGTQAMSYSASVGKASSSFEEGDYETAYESMAGVDVSESSKEMKDKIRICMQLKKELNSYTNYYNMKMYLEALDSLVKGIYHYDTNLDKAKNYEIMVQYNALEGEIASMLYNEFGVSESEARAIIRSETQETYTERLEAIISRWEKKNKQDER